MCHGLNMLNNLHIFALLLIKSKLRCKKYLTGTCNIACSRFLNLCCVEVGYVVGGLKKIYIYMPHSIMYIIGSFSVSNTILIVNFTPDVTGQLIYCGLFSNESIVSG